MNELSLFSGIGGGLLGTKLLGFRHIGYVEWDAYCQRVIKARIADGLLDAAPIFSDVQRFVSEGYARSYQGLVNVLSAGFPCQPNSVAGNMLGEADPRDMWPATRECIRIIRPDQCLLENVPGLLMGDYIRNIFGDLAALGYDARWGVLSGLREGAPHLRERLWIVADNREKRNQGDKSKAIRWQPSFSWGKDGGRSEIWARRPDISESLLRRMGDGPAFSMDRVGACGNGQIPIVAARAWQVLSQ